MTVHSLPPLTTNDTELSILVAEIHADDLVWTPGTGWFEYKPELGRWVEVTNARVETVVADDLLNLYRAWLSVQASVEEQKKLPVLRTIGKISAVVRLMAGRLEKSDDSFDAYPYLLNTPGGVVDLHTGNLQPHDPKLLLTKQTAVTPGPAHPLWQQALEAVPADILPWYAQQFGLALIGEMRPGGVVVVNQGGGSNGKTTLMGTAQDAMGDYAILLDDKVITAPSNAHSTEKTELKGARLALLEETEKAGRLNVNNVKKLADTETITARRIRKDSMTWKASHTIFISTNYRPVVTETDHGTWRRLALVVYPHTFAASDFRLRVKSPEVQAAALSWMIEGAKSVIANHLPLPEAVRTDTLAWRSETDLIVAFFADRIEADPGSAVLSTELHSEFNAYIGTKGHLVPWTDRHFVSELESHDVVKTAGVKKGRVRVAGLSLSRPMEKREAPVPGGEKPMVWQGIRFKDNSDEVLHEVTVSWVDMLKLAGI